MKFRVLFLSLTFIFTANAYASDIQLRVVPPVPARSSFTIPGDQQVQVNASGLVIAASGGVGVQGGLTLIESGEWMEFTFPRPVSVLNYNPSTIVNGGDQFIEAWGAGNVFLGSVFARFDLPSWAVVASVGGITNHFGQPVQRFKVTMVDDGRINIVDLEYQGEANLNAYIGMTAMQTSYSSTPCAQGLNGGTYTITATFRNVSRSTLNQLRFVKRTLTGGNIICNADEGDTNSVTVPEAQVVIDRDDERRNYYLDGLLQPGISFTVVFQIGLVARAPFSFFVDGVGGGRIP